MSEQALHSPSVVAFPNKEDGADELAATKPKRKWRRR
jgi:hypothetical protein